MRLENRTGVNTGEVITGDVSSGQRLVTGDTVNTAARLEQAAPPLQILISEPTYRLVRDAVEIEPIQPFELKGKAERVLHVQASCRSRRTKALARRMDAPMVGRDTELAKLMDAARAGSIECARAARDGARPRGRWQVPAPSGIPCPRR